MAVTGLLVLAGCASTRNLTDDYASLPLSAPAASHLQPGSLQATVIVGALTGVHGCTLAYESHLPSQPVTDSMVFLAHGFLRNLETMRGWAQHWASHGVPVTVMSLCNSSPLSGRHDRDAMDITLLADELHEGPRIYAGFSAGGLAAFLAAAADDRATGYLGLDAVDSKALAREPDLFGAHMSLLLFAEPSACNAQNNMLDAAAAARGGLRLRVRNTTHCHYEYPYDKRCEIVCGAVEPAEVQTLLIDTVRSLATAWLLSVAGGTGGSSGLALDHWRGFIEPLP